MVISTFKKVIRISRSNALFRIRIDYSITKRAHSPTPGVYMGVKGRDGRHGSSRYGGGRRDRDYGRPRARRLDLLSTIFLS